MSSMMVTANLGGSTHEVATKALGHLLREEPRLTFLQEVPSGFPDANDLSGYRVVMGENPHGWKIRSSLLVHPDLPGEITPVIYPSGAYHGSYLAVADWHDQSGSLVCRLASVHASPTEAESERYGWPTELAVTARRGQDNRYVDGRLWDSDLVLASLQILSGAGTIPLIAAGDFNEARLHDLDRSTRHRLGTWVPTSSSWRTRRICHRGHGSNGTRASAPREMVFSLTTS